MIYPIATTVYQVEHVPSSLRLIVKVTPVGRAMVIVSQNALMVTLVEAIAEVKNFSITILVCQVAVEHQQLKHVLAVMRVYVTISQAK